jgi:hypothetical protein
MKGLYILTFFLIFGCSGHRDQLGERDQDNLKANYFKNTFLKKFKRLDLPTNIIEGKQIDPKKLTSNDPKSLDSLFTQSGSILCYGILTDTSSFYTLIFYAPTVTFIPVISTYDKKGNRISDKGIDFGCWDGGPYDYSCDGHLTVDNKMNLNLEHVTICNDCDSTSTEPVKFIEKRKGKITNNGQVELEARKEGE